MKRAVALALVVACAAKLHAETNQLSEAQLDGLRIAKEVRELRLMEDARGILKIYKGRPLSAEIPFRLLNSTTSSNWSATFTAETTNQVHVATLTVVHSENAPNVYQLSDGTNSPTTLNCGDLMTSFADSDFSAADFGLDFLHWSGQRLLTNQVHRSQSCHKLESVNSHPVTNGYTRVVSWIDIDTGGIVEAEAWSGKKKLKVFEPTSVQKVNGQYVVKELEMRNVQAGTRSVLVFNYDKKK